MLVRVQGSRPTAPDQGKCKRVPSFGGIWYYLLQLQTEMLHDLVLLLQICLNTCAPAKIPGPGLRLAAALLGHPSTGRPSGAAVTQSHSRC